jgi:hypothetical protein
MTRRHVRMLVLIGLCAAIWFFVLPALGRKAPQPSFVKPGQPSVTLSFRTTPKVKAKVRWGQTLLGETPLTIKWPRDSGPLDVTVTAPGYLPLHTRVYTFTDDKLHLMLTAEQDKKNLFGYRKELPDLGTVPDGGAAPPPPPPLLSPAPQGPPPLLARPPGT